MPNGGSFFAFADADNGVTITEPSMLWLASKYHEPAYLWRHLDDLASGYDNPQYKYNEVIYYEPAVGQSDWGALPLAKLFSGTLESVAVARTSFTDRNAVFVGLKGGSTRRYGHSHLDVGSFVLAALGETWVEDLGSDNYAIPGYFLTDASRAGTSDYRYSIYRIRAEGHNTLVLDPDAVEDQHLGADDQVVGAEAPFTMFETTLESTTMVLDLTQAYAADAVAAARGIKLLRQTRQVLVQDEVTPAGPTALWWFAHTQAAINLGVGGRTAVLSRNGKEVRVALLTPETASFTVRDPVPFPTTPTVSGNASNTGFRKLAIHIDGDAQVRLAVLFTPVFAGESPPETLPIVPLAEWGAGEPPALTILSPGEGATCTESFILRGTAAGSLPYSADDTVRVWRSGLRADELPPGATPIGTFSRDSFSSGTVIDCGPDEWPAGVSHLYVVAQNPFGSATARVSVEKTATVCVGGKCESAGARSAGCGCAASRAADDSGLLVLGASFLLAGALWRRRRNPG